MHTIAGEYFGITEISDCPVRNLASPLEWKKKSLSVRGYKIAKLKISKICFLQIFLNTLKMICTDF